MIDQTKEEKISIKTLKDIVEKVPLENLEEFLADLKMWVETVHVSKTVYGKMLKNYGMYWINDGQNKINSIDTKIIYKYHA